MALTTYTRLATVVSAIAANAGQNSATAPQTSITAIGDIELARREGPSRVVWVPGEGELVDPDQDETELSKIGYEWRLDCSVLFVGATYDQAEGLLLDFLAAVRRKQQGTVVPGRTSKAGETITAANRYGITLAVMVKIPVPFETYTAGDVDSASVSGTVTDID